jgi:hypothetical protein
MKLAARDLHYFEIRAAEEERAARQAPHPAAASAHRVMAHKYSVIVRKIRAQDEGF